MSLKVQLDDEVAARLHAEAKRIEIPFDVLGNQILRKMLAAPQEINADPLRG